MINILRPVLELTVVIPGLLLAIPAAELQSQIFCTETLWLASFTLSGAVYCRRIFLLSCKDFFRTFPADPDNRCNSHLYDISSGFHLEIRQYCSGGVCGLRLP